MFGEIELLSKFQNKDMKIITSEMMNKMNLDFNILIEFLDCIPFLFSFFTFKDHFKIKIDIIINDNQFFDISIFFIKIGIFDINDPEISVELIGILFSLI